MGNRSPLTIHDCFGVDSAPLIFAAGKGLDPSRHQGAIFNNNRSAVGSSGSKLPDIREAASAIPEVCMENNADPELIEKPPDGEQWEKG